MFTLEDIERALSDVLLSTEDSIRPLLKPSRSVGGIFALPREVSCYIDFLGALYSGWDGKNKKEIATSKKAITFIKEIFGEIDLNYRIYGELFYRVVRHGTVHHFSPYKIERDDGATLEWLIYGGRRKSCFGNYAGKECIVNHLEPFTFNRSNKKRDIFPVSLDCLYEDLRKAIELYLDKIKKEVREDKRELLEKYVSVMQVLMKSNKVKDLTW
ncbi:hypothetical protein ACFL2G_01190 [Candidatus Omnitrophota bacterium]